MYSTTSYSSKKNNMKKNKSPKKLSEFQKFQKDEPFFPDYTCPHIDTIIDLAFKSNEELEKLRTMNAQLRDNAEYWKQCCEEMQEKVDNFNEWKENLRTEFEKDI